MISGKVGKSLFLFSDDVEGMLHHDFNGVLAFECWNNIAFDGLSIHRETLHTLLHTIRIADMDEVLSTAELTLHRELTARSWYAWVDEQSVVAWLHTEDILLFSAEFCLYKVILL